MGLFNLDTIKESTINSINNDAYELPFDIIEEGFKFTAYNSANISLLESYIDYTIIHEGSFIDKIKGVIDTVIQFMKNLFNKIKNFILKLFGKSKDRIEEIDNEFKKTYDELKKAWAIAIRKDNEAGYFDAKKIKIIDKSKLREEYNHLSSHDSKYDFNALNQLKKVHDEIKKNEKDEDFTVPEGLLMSIEKITKHQDTIIKSIDIKKIMYDDADEMHYMELKLIHECICEMYKDFKDMKSKKDLDKELDNIVKELNAINNTISSSPKVSDFDKKRSEKGISEALNAISKLTSIKANEYTKMISARLQDILKLANYNLKCAKDVLNSMKGGQS